MLEKNNVKKMNAMKKICLFVLLSVAALGQAWGLGMTSVKFDFTSPNDLTRFTGVWGWTVKGGVLGDATAVRQAWESGAFFQTFPNPDFFADEKITYNEASGAYEYSRLKYYSNNSEDLHVFALVKLPPGMSYSDVPGALVKKYVVAGPWIGEKPAVEYKIKWGVPEEPQTCWRDTSVSLLSVAQRWPWSNVVDYSYEIKGLNSFTSYKLAFEMRMGEQFAAVTNELTTTSEGVYSGTIDLLDYFPNGTRDERSEFAAKIIERR